MTARRMLTIGEAATALALTETTLRRLARRGAVPAAKLGGEWRFPADIADLLVKATRDGWQEKATGDKAGSR